jgi:hypothetical protein
MSTAYPSPPSVAFEEKDEPVWFLKERVVVAWHDKNHTRPQHLGEPSPLNKDASLVLWLGLDRNSNHAIVMLQLAVTHYVKTKRKKFHVFLAFAHVRLMNKHIPILSIQHIPTHISPMFHDIQGSSKSRFLTLSLQKSSACQTLMPVRHSTRPVQGTAEHVMLSTKAFAESAGQFDLYIAYSMYAYQALTQHFTALKSCDTFPAFQLKDAYNHNGGALDSWDDYVSTDSSRKATDDNADLDPRRTRKRKRARSSQEEEESPPIYAKVCTPADEVLVPASDYAPSPDQIIKYNKRQVGGSVVPTTPINAQHSQSFLLDPLETPESLPPRLSPDAATTIVKVAPVPLDAHYVLLESHRTDIKKTLHQAFITWLTSMKKLHPCIHQDEDIYTMLVAFGLAIQTADAPRFPNVKARSTSLVSMHHVAHPSDTHDWNVSPEKMVQRMVRWMCGQVLHADEELIGDILGLTQRAVDLKKHHDIYEGGDCGENLALVIAAREEYLRQEAVCIGNFFVKYAHILVRHLT